MSLAKFLTKLHSEVLDHCGEVHNFASLLRCSCLIYRSSRSRRAGFSRQRAAPWSPRPNRFPPIAEAKTARSCSGPAASL